MNKQSHRIVFNEARGQLMAVAETAQSGHGGGSRTGTIFCQGTLGVVCAHVRPLALSLWLGGLVGLSLPSQAQIVADPRAPANQRPNVLTSPNGTPVVNIQTPSAAGVSRNTYQQFDVNAQGVILNNARTGQRTQTGGTVAGNPWLARGTARVILNEVNSSNPSQLKGYVEVSGDRAQVVIANPAGITCDGCGFINANRATLTTGTPVINGGSLDAYRVERGAVKIEGRGLDASGTNYTDIIARTTQINGKIYAKDLKVTAGANLVSADHSQATRIAGQGEAASVAIDTGTLGGMYANKIHLVGTEAGVGVRNAGQIGAAAGDVVVTADGQIVNSGQIQASGSAVLTAQRITNSGTLYAGRAQLKAGQIEHQSGLIGASGSVSLLADQIKTAHGAALAAGMQADGSLSGEGALTLQGDTIDSHGDHLAAGDITVKGQRINLTDALLQTKMTMRAEGESLYTDRAKLIAANYMMAAYVLSNRGGQIFQTGSGGNQFRVRELDNNEGTVVLKGETSLDVGKLDNTKGALVNLDGALHIRTVELNNTQGQIEASDSTQTGDGLRTKVGTDVHIEASGTVNNTGGTITGHQTSLVSGNLVETGGTLLGKDALSVSTQRSTGDGDLLTQGSLDYRVQSSVMRTGKIIAKVANLSIEGLWTQAGSLQAETFHLHSQGYTQTDKGEVEAQTGQIQTGQFSNQGLINVDTLRLDAAEARNTGRLYGNEISLGAGKLTNDKGSVIAAREQLNLGVGELHNQGDLLSMGDMQVGGRLDAQGKAIEKATLVHNSSGLIEAQGRLDIDALRTVNERTTFVTGQSTQTSAERKQAVRSDEDGTTSVTNTDIRVQTAETQVTQDSGAGMIRGGTVVIKGALHNDKSQIQGGDVQYDPTQYTEVSAPRGLRTVSTQTQVNGQVVASTTQTTEFEIDGVRPLITATGRLGLTNHDVPAAPAAQPAAADAAVAAPAPAAAPAAEPDGAMTRARAMPLPNSQLFQLDTGGNTFLQTDARFANTQSLVNGDALLKALGVDPASVTRRLGDGLMEQRIVTDQIINLTGRQHLAGFANTQDEYQTLMNNGVEEAKALGLKPGQALTPEQVKKLGKDIVWLEERTVTLPDGRTVQALVPQVYARLSESAPTRLSVTQGVGVVSGAVIDIDIQGAYTQRGTMAASQAVQIKADDLTLQGQVISRDIFLQATHDIVNDGAQVMAGRNLSVKAGGDIRGASTVVSSGANTDIGRLSAWTAGNSERGELLLEAGRDLQFNGSLIQNNSAGLTSLKAGRDIVLGTVRVSSQTHTGDASNYKDVKLTQDGGTQIQSKGDVQLDAGRDLHATAAMIQSTEGGVLAIAKNDILLDAGERNVVVDEQKTETKRRWFKKVTTTTHTHTEESEALGTGVSGVTVQMQAGQDMTALGAQIASDKRTQLVAGRDVNLGTADNSQDTHTEVQRRTTGIFKSGSTALTWGHRTEVTQNDTATHTVTGTRVGSTQGEVVIQAGRNYTQVGSEVLAQGDVQIQAANVLIQEARNSQQVHQSNRTQTSGLSLAVSSSTIGAVQTLDQMHDASRVLDGDGRMQLLAGMSSAMNVSNLAHTLSSGSLTGDVSATLTLGSSHSSSEAMQSVDSGAASQVAGRNVRINASAEGATGAGAHDVTIRGSQIQATEVVSLKADGELKLLASEDHQSERSSNHSGNAGAGIGFTQGQGGAGMGLTVVGGAGQGDSHGQTTVHRNSHVTAGQGVSLSSGGDTVIQGAVVKAPQIVADVGGKLIMASPQDTASYSGKQWQVSGSASYGWGVGVSVQVSGNHLTNDYQSVGEQTALRAGDGGFQITARGGTKLTGAQITSTQAAVDANRNTLSTPSVEVVDLHNHSHIQGNALGVSQSAGTKETKDDKGQTVKADAVSYSGGVGNIDERGESVSTAAVSGLAGAQGARTGDAATGLVNHFDPAQAQKKLAAQVAITQAFSAVAPKAVAEFAALQQLQANRQLQAAAQEPDPEKRERMIQEAKDQLEGWKEGGKYRVAAHTFAGTLGAGWQGALGAGGSAALKDQLAALQANVQGSLTEAGFSGDVAKMLGQLTVQVGTSVAGASVAGVPGAQWSTSVDVNNRQLHPYELKWITDHGKDFAAQLSQALERPVTELEADYWLTVAGQSDVDRQMAQSNREFVRGLGGSEEARSYDLAKAYIASNTRGNNPANAFVDERGQLQSVFSTTGQDYYRPEVYAEWRNNAHYRDIHWTILGWNLKGDNMTPEEQAIYDQRQAQVNKQTVKELVAFAGVGLAGRRAITAPQRAADRTAALAEAEAVAARRVEVNASRDADLTTPAVTGRAQYQQPTVLPEPQGVVGAYSGQSNPEPIRVSAGPGYTSAPRYDPVVAGASVPDGYRAYDMPNLPSGMRGVVDIHTGEIKAYSDTGQVFDIGAVRQPAYQSGVLDGDGNRISTYVAPKKYGFETANDIMETGRNLEMQARSFVSDEAGTSFGGFIQSQRGANGQNGIDLAYYRHTEDGGVQLVLGEAKAGDSKLTSFGGGARPGTLDSNLREIEINIRSISDDAVRGELRDQLLTRKFEVELYVSSTNAMSTPRRFNSEMAQRIEQPLNRVVVFPRTTP